MNDLDDIATGAVAELKATAAHLARTEEGLAALAPTSPTRRWPMILSLAAATVLLGGGLWFATRDTHDRSIGPATTPAQVDTSTVPTTAEDTTAASTTTVPALPVSAVVLRPDGVGDARFGMPLAAARSVMRAALGAPSSDTSLTNNVAEPTRMASLSGSDSGGFWDGWVFPTSRRMCWGGDGAGFCASFGGSSPDSLTFVGWDYTGRGATDVPLTDADGITTDVSWARIHSLLTPLIRGCFITAESTTLTGIGVEFGIPSGAAGVGLGAGCHGETAPVVSVDLDPSTIRVTGMAAGRRAESAPGD